MTSTVTSSTKPVMIAPGKHSSLHFIVDHSTSSLETLHHLTVNVKQSLISNDGGRGDNWGKWDPEIHERQERQVEHWEQWLDITSVYKEQSVTSFWWISLIQTTSSSYFSSTFFYSVIFNDKGTHCLFVLFGFILMAIIRLNQNPFVERTKLCNVLRIASLSPVFCQSQPCTLSCSGTEVLAHLATPHCCQPPVFLHAILLVSSCHLSFFAMLSLRVPSDTAHRSSVSGILPLTFTLSTLYSPSKCFPSILFFGHRALWLWVRQKQRCIFVIFLLLFSR